MNHWQKLGMPVALGICAAFLNWQSISRKLEPREYVGVNKEINAGEMVGNDALVKVTVSHSAGVELRNALVEWSRKDSLIGRFAQRSIKKNNLFTQFDLFEANILKPEKNEITELVAYNEPPHFFVGDLVNVLDGNGRTIEGWRVLSIVQKKPEGKGCFEVKLAIDESRLANLKKDSKINLQDLKIK